MENQNFSVHRTLGRAWKLVDGSKAALWSVNTASILVIVFVMMVLIAIATPLLMNYDHSIADSRLMFGIVLLVINLVVSALIAPLLVGAMMTAIKHVRGETITAKTGYQYLNRWLPAILAVFVIMLITNAVTAFVSVALNTFIMTPAIVEVSNFICTALIYTLILFSLPLVADKKLGAFSAIVTSMKLVIPHWFRTFVLMIITFILLTFSIIPLIIGILLKTWLAGILGAAISILILTWMLPYGLLILGVTYVELQNKTGK